MTFYISYDIVYCLCAFLIKAWISNLVCTTRFCNNLHHVRSKLKHWKAKQF